MTHHTAKAYDTEDSRWQAVLARDAQADGAFYFAVRTTGVFCRPACPCRRPRRENVMFFDGAEAAEQAGFRPCLRCRPKEVNTQQRVVAQVQSLLDSAEASPTLAQLGQAVGLSPYHLQRLFKRATGLSPREYASARRAERLKAGLKRGASVTEAMYEAGFGSARALYEKAHHYLGMKPGEYRQGSLGQEITYACVQTPLGHMLVAETRRGICALRFGEPDDMVRDLRSEFPQATLHHDQAALEPTIGVVLEHLAGSRSELELPVDVRATAFQQRVWAALRTIPYGQTRSYREVAQMIGEPSAVRAVARACATNPVALIVPCHRVVRSGGEISGYRWGVERKQALLVREKAGT
ncbi:MAG TPA: bifunctional DNA-binding transcriptional regulator/O6-methylguanine-DNA methyltransferase Ada [Symbiobacteriaceae bacterium]|nr:bifunctional DNA-binding transcriptional regulator/O6-methylguanine-DNA methyltransferase Ada [Symbiobacteriaceae bacterium]